MTQWPVLGTKGSCLVSIIQLFVFLEKTQSNDQSSLEGKKISDVKEQIVWAKTVIGLIDQARETRSTPSVPQ